MTPTCSSCFSMIFLRIMSLSSNGIYGELYVRPYSRRLPIFFSMNMCLWTEICPGLGGGLDKNSTGIVLALCGRNTLKKSLDMSITSKCIVNFFVSLYLFSSIECSNLILVALHGVERSEIIVVICFWIWVRLASQAIADTRVRVSP